jgi:uracil-DNA glycosylase family 4
MVSLVFDYSTIQETSDEPSFGGRFLTRQPIMPGDTPLSFTPLDAVRSAIVDCDRCERLRSYCSRVAREKKRAHRDDTYWGRPVPGFGDPGARVLLVGLAPAAHGANRTGRPFTGDGPGGSADFLIGALHRTGFASQPTSLTRDDGLTLRDVYISMAVRCAPPDNKPFPEEIARCLPHFDAETACLANVKVVVALGHIAFDAWLRLCRLRGAPVRPKPVFGHGEEVKLGAAGASTLIGCYHPSRQNTNTGRLTAPMLDAVLRRARTLARR